MDMNDDDDDEAPPMLVAAGPNVETGIEADMEEMNLVKVPITLVTGKLHPTLESLWRLSLFLHARWCFNDTNKSRLPGIWENNVAQLHFERETWQKGRRNIEWLVITLRRL